MRESPRSEVSDSAIAALLPLARKGGGPVPGLESYRVQIGQGDGCAVYTIVKAGIPIRFGGVCWHPTGSTAFWSILESAKEEVWKVIAPPPGSRKEMPETVPWLGVIMLPRHLELSGVNGPAIFEFETHLAWALIDYGRGVA